MSMIDFRESILSAVHYLVKYPHSFSTIKVGNKYGSSNFLYFSLTEILSEEFIKTYFSVKDKSIGGNLVLYSTQNYKKWIEGYFDDLGHYHAGWNQDSHHWCSGKPIWTVWNMFPIYLFSGANSNQFGVNDFAEFMVSLFKSISGEQYEGINKILKLS
jgi:hypothetical protein